MSTVTDTAADLRAWANGMHTTEAAAGNPWIQPNDHGGHWIDLEAIPSHIGALSSGERAYLQITASIGLGGSDGDHVAVNLSNAVPSLGREQLELVLAAIAHAGGSHQHSDFVVNEHGTASVIKLSSLYPWPEQT